MLFMQTPAVIAVLGTMLCLPVFGSPIPEAQSEIFTIQPYPFTFELASETETCGQWNAKATLLRSLTANKTACLKACQAYLGERKGTTISCNLAFIDPSKTSKNCSLYKEEPSTSKVPGRFPFFLPGQELCSFRENVVIPESIEDLGCKQISIKATRISGVTLDVSHETCLSRCNATKACSLSLYRFDTSKQKTSCQLAKKGTSFIKYHPNEVACLKGHVAPRKLNCGQWEFFGHLLSNSTAMNSTECQQRCTGDCDVFMFGADKQCHLYNSKVVAQQQVRFIAGDQLCSFTYKGSVPMVPVGGCNQTRITGDFIGEEFSSSSASTCFGACQNTKNCTNALFRHQTAGGINSGICRLFKQGENGKEYKFYPSESSCSRLNCGQWRVTATQINTIPNVGSKLQCLGVCLGYNGCEGFQFDSFENRCRLFNSFGRGRYFVDYSPGDQLCSLTYAGTELPFPAGGCKQTDIYGDYLGYTFTAQSANDCHGQCVLTPECDWAFFRHTSFDTSSGSCIFVQLKINWGMRYFDAQESACPRNSTTPKMI